MRAREARPGNGRIVPHVGDADDGAEPGRVAAPPRRFAVLVNAAAGSVEDSRRQCGEIDAAFLATGVHVAARAVDPPDLPQAVRDAWREHVDAVVVAGGDGTISCAAGVAAELDAVLGVLPMGTFNHFAKDLGIPQDLEEAVRCLAAAPVAAVDVGEVNGRVFVNNASIGVYPEMVLDRDDIRRRRGWGKIRAVPVAALRTLRRMPAHRVRLVVDGGPAHAVSTSLLFVGNGLFDHDGGKVGARSSLVDGRLGLYVVGTTSRWRLVANALALRVGGLGAAPQTTRSAAATVLVRARERRLTVALDGEPLTLEAPLLFRTRPGGLRVLAPGA